MGDKHRTCEPAATLHFYFYMDTLFAQLPFVCCALDVVMHGVTQGECESFKTALLKVDMKIEVSSDKSVDSLRQRLKRWLSSKRIDFVVYFRDQVV